MSVISPVPVVSGEVIRTSGGQSDGVLGGGTRSTVSGDSSPGEVRTYTLLILGGGN